MKQFHFAVPKEGEIWADSRTGELAIIKAVTTRPSSYGVPESVAVLCMGAQLTTQVYTFVPSDVGADKFAVYDSAAVRPEGTEPEVWDFKFVADSLNKFATGGVTADNVAWKRINLKVLVSSAFYMWPAHLAEDDASAEKVTVPVPSKTHRALASYADGHSDIVDARIRVVHRTDVAGRNAHKVILDIYGELVVFRTKHAAVERMRHFGVPVKSVCQD